MRCWNASLSASDRDQRMTVTLLVKNIRDKSYTSFSQVGGQGVGYSIESMRGIHRLWKSKGMWEIMHGSRGTCSNSTSGKTGPTVGLGR